MIRIKICNGHHFMDIKKEKLRIINLKGSNKASKYIIAPTRRQSKSDCERHERPFELYEKRKEKNSF